MNKKRRFIHAVVLSLLASIAVFVAAGCSSKPELNLYSWADNFDMDVLKEFENQYDVKVNYAQFSNNEELLAKLKAGNAAMI